MEHILITYRMSRPSEVAETCIVLPMTAGIASDVLECYGESDLIGEGGCPHGGFIVNILDSLAGLQGYDYAEFIKAEPQEHYVTEEESV